MGQEKLPAKFETGTEELSFSHLTLPMQSLQVADEVAHLIKEKRLSANIQGKEFVMAEGWQFAGLRFGILPICDEPVRIERPDEVIYKCTCSLIEKKTGQTVGKGYGFCSSKEPSKRKFEEYAIASMSQTRSIGKAYRNLLSFLMKASGFEPTPLEEMDDVKEVKGASFTPTTDAKVSEELPPIDITKEKYGGTGVHKDKVFINVPLKYIEVVLSTPAYKEKISARKLDAMQRTIDYLKGKGTGKVEEPPVATAEQTKVEPTPPQTEEPPNEQLFGDSGEPIPDTEKAIKHAIDNYLPPPIMKALETSPCNEWQKNFLQNFCNSTLFADSEKDIIAEKMNELKYNECILYTSKAITEYNKRWVMKYQDTSGQ